MSPGSIPGSRWLEALQSLAFSSRGHSGLLCLVAGEEQNHGASGWFYKEALEVVHITSTHTPLAGTQAYGTVSLQRGFRNCISVATYFATIQYQEGETHIFGEQLAVIAT